MKNETQKQNRSPIIAIGERLLLDNLLENLKNRSQLRSITKGGFRTCYLANIPNHSVTASANPDFVNPNKGCNHPITVAAISNERILSIYFLKRESPAGFPTGLSDTESFDSLL